MPEKNDKINKARKRDEFMGFLTDTLNALEKEDKEKAISCLLKVAQNYGSPEYDSIDIVLARDLYKVDEKSSIQFQNELKNNEEIFSSGNLPKWAKVYLEVMSSGPAPSDDDRRLSFFRSLSNSHPSSLESRFLLATALTKSACDEEGNEEKFKEALSILKKIQDSLSQNPERASTFRTGSLFEERPHDIVKDFYKWVLKNYIYQLQCEERLDVAIKLLDEANKEKDTELLFERRTLEFQQRITGNFKETIQEIQTSFEEKVKAAQEESQNKHIEILTIFLTLISIVVGGLLSLFSAVMTYNSLIMFALSLFAVMSMSLSFLANNFIQISLRTGTGLICLILLLIFSYHSANFVENTDRSISPIQKELIVDRLKE